jgi:FkbM family methyltransferase
LSGRHVRKLLGILDARGSNPLAATVQSERLRLRKEDYREYIHRNIYFMGYHEYRETRLLKKLLNHGDTFVDVGANIGWFSILAASLVGEQGCVIALEPSKRIFEHLSANVALNSMTNIRAENVALSNQKGSARLSGIADDNAGTGTIVGPETSSGEEVPTMRFDDYRSSQALEQMTLMKIDVERAEMLVLEGAHRSLNDAAIANIVVEVSDERLRSTGNSSAELISLLRQCGYHISRLTNTGVQSLEPGEHVEFSNFFAQRAPSAMI